MPGWSSACALLDHKLVESPSLHGKAVLQKIFSPIHHDSLVAKQVAGKASSNTSYGGRELEMGTVL